MSDFVRNVLRRGAGLAPVVAPRRAAAPELIWLEPPAAVEAPAMWRPAAVPARAAIQNAPEVQRQAPPPSAFELPATNPQPAAAGPAPAAPNAARWQAAQPPPVQDAFQTAAAAAERHPGEGGTLVRQVAEAGLSAEPGQASRARADFPPHLEIAVRAAEVPAAVPQPHPKLPATTPPAAAEPAAAEPVAVVAPRAPEPKIATIEVPPPVAGPRMQAPGPAPSTEPAPAQPAVQVSIGHIEFAQLPPAPSAPRRAPAGFANRALERRYLDRRWY